jgi:hypothetical protein
MPELELVVREVVGRTVPTKNTIDATMAHVLHPSFGSVVDTQCNARDAKMLGQEGLVVLVTIRIHVRLHGGYDVGVLGRGDGLEEHGCAIPCVDEDMFLGLKPEIELEAPSQFQNAGISVPCRLIEWDCRIKHWYCEFKDAP